MPISNHRLTTAQLKHVKELAHRCQQLDGNTIPIYSNTLLQQRTLPCNLLYYRQQQLIGFASVFFFYENACELTLMVDPAFRRRHIAKVLTSTILPVIHARALAHIICSSPKGLNNHWLPTLGFQYHNCELQMQWNNTSLPIASKYPELTILRAVHDDDITPLMALDTACFHTQHNEISPRFQQLLRDKTYTLFIMRQGQQAIGKAHLHQEIDQTQLSDIAILPEHQGKGLGQQLIAHCIHHARSTSRLPLRLDVEYTNNNALHLYQKLGFETRNTWDCWTMAIPDSNASAATAWFQHC